MATLADIDGSQLPSPFVQVAEQVAATALQTGEVEPAFERRLRKLSGSGRSQISFGCFKRCRVGNAEAILQDTGRRIEIVVMAGISRHVEPIVGDDRPKGSPRRGACPPLRFRHW